MYSRANEEKRKNEEREKQIYKCTYLYITRQAIIILFHVAVILIRHRLLSAGLVSLCAKPNYHL